MRERRASSVAVAVFASAFGLGSLEAQASVGPPAEPTIDLHDDGTTEADTRPLLADDGGQGSNRGPDQGGGDNGYDGYEAPPSAGPFEFNVDRPGSDYVNFELANDAPERSAAQCATACEQDGRCRAWTWVQPGVQGVLPRCWLKNAVPAPVPNAPFAISGVGTRGQGQVPPAGGQVPPAATPVPPPGAPAPTAAVGNFGGRWVDGTWGNINLTQIGNQVDGIYSANTGGVFRGTVQGNLVTGEYVAQGGTARGTIRWELSPDGSRFTGVGETTGWAGRFDATRAP